MNRTMEEEKYRIINYNKMEKLNRQRINALYNWDEALFYSLCKQMGVQPEDDLIIEKAETEKLYWKIKRENNY